uniref:DUF2490 domain-containing protein n=1 Tax=Paenibacillus abyssi TaxID=1340531 RepID=UPI003670D541
MNLTAQGAIADKVVYFAEFQPRMGDGISRLDQLLLRGAVGVKLSPAVTLYQGSCACRAAVGRRPRRQRGSQLQQLNLALGHRPEAS